MLVKAGVTAAAVFGTWWLRTRWTDPTTRLQATLPGAGKLVIVAGVELFVWDTLPDGGAEKREIVFFSHGWLFSHTMFTKQIIALHDAGYRCIAWDHQGQGSSGPVGEGYTIEQSYEQALELMQSFLGAGESAHFVGLSMGGMVGMRLGTRNPTLIKTLTLLDTQAGAEPNPEKAKKPNPLGLLMFFGGRLGARLLGGEITRAMVGPTTIADKGKFALVYSMLMSNMLHAMAKIFLQPGWIWLALMDRASVEEEITKITAPTLVGVGDEDVPCDVGKARHIHELVKGSELVIFTGAGHTSPVEQPEQVTASLMAFLKKHA